MTSPVTHMRRSIHMLSAASAREVAITSWYDTRLRTWQAMSPDYPYFAETRPRAIPLISFTRHEAVRSVLTSLHQSLRDA